MRIFKAIKQVNIVSRRLDKVSPFLSEQVSSLLTTVPQSRPTAEQMLLRLKRSEESGDCSPLLESADSLGTQDTKPMVSVPCSSKYLVGIGTLVVLAIIGIIINWSSTAYSTNTTADTVTTSADITTKNPWKKRDESFKGCGILPGKKDVDMRVQLIIKKSHNINFKHIKP